MKVSELLRALQGLPLDSDVAIWDGYSAYSKELDAVSLHHVRGIFDKSQSQVDLTKPVVALIRHPNRGYALLPNDVYGHKPIKL